MVVLATRRRAEAAYAGRNSAAGSSNWAGDRLEHFDRGVRLIQNVEVYAGHAGVNQALHLPRRVLDAHLELAMLIALMGFEVADEVGWQLGATERCDALDLRQVGDRQNPRRERRRDAGGLVARRKRKKSSLS